MSKHRLKRPGVTEQEVFAAEHPGAMEMLRKDRAVVARLKRLQPGLKGEEARIAARLIAVFDYTGQFDKTDKQECLYLFRMIAKRVLGVREGSA